MMIVDRLTYRLFAHFVILFGGASVCGVAWSASVIQPDLVGLPWPQIMVGALISFWGGIARTAVRALEVAQAQRDGIKTDSFNLGQEVIKDLIVSSGIGFLVYSLAISFEFDLWKTGAALFISGYLGTRFLVGAGDVVLSYLASKAKGPTP